MNTRIVIRSLLCALLALVSLPACVRLMDEGSFVCHGDSDCAADQKCLGSFGTSICVAKDHCLQTYECADNETCVSNHCKVTQCTYNNDKVCGDYSCDVNGSCNTQCFSQSGCKNGKVCRSNQCVVPPAPGIGEFCDGTVACGSGHCCVGTSRTCATSCVCSGDYQCGSGEHCCKSKDSTGSACVLGACPLADTGEYCASNSACKSGLCVSGMCKAVAKPDGSTCSTNADCTSSACCGSQQTGVKTCTILAVGDACPVLLGDYCQADGCTEGYCDGPTNFSSDGYCSAGCPAGGCGFNSKGLENKCITLTTGSSPAAACKPGCATDGDCLAVHPYLHCYPLDDGSGACDFETSSWGKQPSF